MLGLMLRKEFQNSTTLLSRETSPTQKITADDFFRVTYPTSDMLRSIQAINTGRTVLIIGEQSLGYLTTTLYHAVNSPSSLTAWLNLWSTILARPALMEARLCHRYQMLAVSGSLYQKRYECIWDVLFAGHPHGSYIRTQWAMMRTPVPSEQLVLELLRHTPTILLLNEFQTWYECLANSRQNLWKQWAFRSIQILSDIARQHPELLILVVSVQDKNTDACKPIYSLNPIQIDIKNDKHSYDRLQQSRRQLLHRLFENRFQFFTSDIEPIIAQHVAEYCRLLKIPSSEYHHKHKEFIDSWPYAPDLFQLLENQILIAPTENREQAGIDMICILADLFRERGEHSPILTPADFYPNIVENKALLRYTADRQVYIPYARIQLNVVSVVKAVSTHQATLPHLQEIVNALWLRSITGNHLVGVELSILQADLTRNTVIGDHLFLEEVGAIIKYGLNICQKGTCLVFYRDDKPQIRSWNHSHSAHLVNTTTSEGSRLFRATTGVFLSKADLMSKLESWGMLPETQVLDVTVKISVATGTQIKELLLGCPDSIDFELYLRRKEC